MSSDRLRKWDELMNVPVESEGRPGADLDTIGQLIDLSADLDREPGLLRALEHIEALRSTGRGEHDHLLLDYFEGNTRFELHRLSPSESPALERPQLEKAIISYRRARLSLPSEKLGKIQTCQMLTNLANALSTLGRTVEAIELWDEALHLEPSFGMALGNRGCGLWYLAGVDSDPGHASLIAHAANRDLTAALALPLEEGAREHFLAAQRSIEQRVDREFLQSAPDYSSFGLGDSDEEIAYRRWALEERLFLNTLNDLRGHSIAATDPLCLPGIVVPLSEGPYYIGFYNQMKQEYASARYQLFSGLHSDQPHFSDRHVTIVNTLDYPSCSLSTELEKMAFRVAYSLLDKVAFFLNHYLALGIEEHLVSFRKVWFKEGGPEEGLRPGVCLADNYGLLGLYWLSKDFYERSPDYASNLQPDAREVACIRNHLEHRYLKLHLDLWPGPVASSEGDGLADTLALSLTRAAFRLKALRLMKSARAALIYLSHAVGTEERRRRRVAGEDRPVGRGHLDVWEDEWKV